MSLPKRSAVQRHPAWSNPPFLMFWHSGALALSLDERQSAWMSEIKNSGLDKYGPEHFEV